jgi:DNA-binding GntR family transcriptional regulator
MMDPVANASVELAAAGERGELAAGERGELAAADPGLVDELAERIHARILAGDFAVGSWLRQEALATSFGVSRTPVREALRKLQADGIVDVLPHRGALVRGPSEVEIREAYLIRGELEGLAAELAATHINADQLRLLRDAEEAFRRAVPKLVEVRQTGVEQVASGPWDTANLDFHYVILDAAGVAGLHRLVADLRKAFPRSLSWTALSEEPSLLEDNITQHERVRAAIERGDAAAARRWMTDHCRRTGDLVATWFAVHYRTEEHAPPVRAAG